MLEMNEVGASQSEVGYIAVGISILFFGSFALPMKSKRVQDACVDPVVFQLYYGVAIFITSWLAVAYEPFEFDYSGILTAAVWVPASILSIFAINYIGLSIAQGLWSGVTIVISFMWGLVLQHTKLKVEWAVLSMLFLIIGIVLVSHCKNRYFFLGSIEAAEGENTRLIVGDYPSVPPPPDYNKLKGFACAVTLGILNGSMLAPSLLRHVTVYQFIPNFGIGVLIMTPIYASMYFGAFKRAVPDLKVKESALLALLAGVLWNIGNVGSIIATAELGLSVGFPLSQLALLVAGFWGLVLFNEFPIMMQKLQFLLSAVVLIIGAIFLLLAG